MLAEPAGRMTTLRDLLSHEVRVDPRLGAREIRGVTADSRKVAPGYALLRRSRRQGRRTAIRAAGDRRRRRRDRRGERGRRDLPDACRFIEVAESAPRAGARGGEILSPPAGHDRRGHRHQRQDLGRRLHPPDLGRARPQGRELGTIGVVSPKGEIYGSLTTPDPVALHETLDQLAGEGVTHLAMEASSHGLDQHRLDGVRHRGRRLHQSQPRPSRLSPDAGRLSRRQAAAVRDAGRARRRGGDRRRQRPCAGAWSPRPRARPAGLHCRRASGETIRLHRCRDRRLMRRRLTLESAGRRHTLHLPLVGDFPGRERAGRRRACDRDRRRSRRRLRRAGRSRRRAGAGSNSSARAQGAPVFVDYAHKPDALAKVARRLAPLCEGPAGRGVRRGGDRDEGKRPLMGEIAAAKRRPRHRHRRQSAQRRPGRDPRRDPRGRARRDARSATAREAIVAAIAGLAAGDVLVIAGKGHETGQIVGDRVLPFSDHEAVAAALEGKAGAGDERARALDGRGDGGRDARAQRAARLPAIRHRHFDRHPHAAAGRCFLRHHGRHPRRP